MQKLIAPGSYCVAPIHTHDDGSVLLPTTPVVARMAAMLRAARPGAPVSDELVKEYLTRVLELASRETGKDYKLGVAAVLLPPAAVLMYAMGRYDAVCDVAAGALRQAEAGVAAGLLSLGSEEPGDTKH